MTTLLVDTSVAIPLMVVDHDDHRSFSEHLNGVSLGLSGHAAFEAYSVLTRLPAPLRRRPDTIAEMLRQNFPATVCLPTKSCQDLLLRLPGINVAGGAVYDALVAAAAVEAGLRLVSADRRAVEIYRALDVDLELLD